MGPHFRSRSKGERYQILGKLMDGSPPVVFLWRIEPRRWTVEAVSAGVEQLLGYKPEEFRSGRVSLFGIAHPEDAPLLERLLEERLEAGSEEWTQEYRVIAKDGRTVWVQDWNRVLRGAGGRATHVQAIVSDITERKRSEGLLRVQRDLLLAVSQTRGLKETLRLCLEAALTVSGFESGGIYLADHEGGLQLAQSVGLSDGFTAAARYYPPDSENTCLVMEGRPVYARQADLEVPLSEAEQREGLRALAVIPIKHELRIIGCMNVASRTKEDVPEHGRVPLEAIASTAALLIIRARADEALRESEERLRLAQQAAEIGTFTWDLLTGASLWSPELEAMHGLPAGGFPGTQEAWEDLIHPEDRDGTLDQVRQSIGSGEPAQGEWRIVWPDGRVRWMQGRWRVFRDETGRPHRMTGVNIDITGRKQAEAALRASREQMRALAARLQAAQEEERRRMARAVHDELGQPLAALGLVLRGIEGDIERMAPGPSVGALTDRIVDASDLADHLGKTVQRLAFDLRPPVLDELGLASALRREAEAFRRRSGVECRVTVSDPDEEPAPGIATALFRIFQEALSNVDRHARARTVDVQFGSVEGAWQLDIVDDGRGIEAGEISRPDAFGLIGMRERAESFGGALTIERRTEGGTAVRVRIPAGREAR